MSAIRQCVNVAYLQRGVNNIAYRKIERTGTAASADVTGGGTGDTPTTISPPGIVFLQGFQSTMEGEKAIALEKYCMKKNLAYIRFDYQACGSSSGDNALITLSDWKSDVLAVLDQLTTGPQILIGSSMGGWLMINAALERPDRIHSLLGIATAADFPQDIYNRQPKEVLDSLQHKPIVEAAIAGRMYTFTQSFHKDLLTANHQHFLAMDTDDKVPVFATTRLLHGMADNTVPHEKSLRLASRLASKDVQMTLVKSAGHRFSESSDIELICDTLDKLLRK